MLVKDLFNLISNPLIYIFLLAFFIRVYDLGNIPAGFHQDEVKIAWNSYSILNTLQDDWGHLFPLHYDSFGDFRPTGYFYLTIPSLLIFGLNEFAVRLPGALFGSLTIISLYYLTQLLVQSTPVKKRIALMAALSLSLLPWHISLSRATSEVIVALFLIITGITTSIMALQSNRKIFYLISTFLIGSSYLFYHTPRLVAPLILFLIALYFSKFSLNNLFKNKYIVVSLLILSILTIIFAFNPEARGRYNQTGLITDQSIKVNLDAFPFEEGSNDILVARILHNKIVLYGNGFINQYIQYFSPSYYVTQNGSKPSRYSTAEVGILTYIEFVLFIIGLISVIRKQYCVLPLLLLFLAPLPAALTIEDTPNLHRALLMAPFVSIIIAFGLNSLIQQKYKFINIGTLFIGLLFLNFIYFLHMYFVHNPIHQPLFLTRNQGSKELGLEINRLKSQFDHIFITNYPDDPYSWYAFFTQQDPQVFNLSAKNRKLGNWSYKNLTFTGYRCPTKYINPQMIKGRYLLVNSEGCEKPLDPAFYKFGEIKRLNQDTVFTLWEYSN